MKEEFDRTSPLGAVKYFRNCIFNGDLPGALGCFHPEATYIERDGQEIRGLENIEKALTAICLWKPKIEGVKHRITIVEDLALWIDNYTVKARTANGDPMEMEGTTACMLKRNAEGLWLWLVDNPFASNDLTL
ncbi:YybH family protein [Desertivirga brevis]|uniref:YybH family protein n=1 Tax=Desertivirga brevis TaxID=2810310 RepID=UPI001A9700E7|nr:nuclear transport factor 2 family protein [Pedobacter sp. SYSU D00873]